MNTLGAARYFLSHCQPTSFAFRWFITLLLSVSGWQRFSQAFDKEGDSSVVSHALRSSHRWPCRLWQCPPACLQREMTTECRTETLVTSLCIAEKFVTFGMLGACHCDTLGFTPGSNSGSMTSSLCLGSTTQILPFYPHLACDLDCSAE